MTSNYRMTQLPEPTHQRQAGKNDNHIDQGKTRPEKGGKIFMCGVDIVGAGVCSEVPSG